MWIEVEEGAGYGAFLSAGHWWRGRLEICQDASLGFRAVGLAVKSLGILKMIVIQIA